MISISKKRITVHNPVELGQQFTWWGLEKNLGINPRSWIGNSHAIA
jgi:hypothetical protein